MIWPLVQTALVDGLLFSIVGLALLVSFGWLRFPDLTPDGAFVLGGAAFGAASHSGFDIPVALAVAVLAGALSGAATATLAVWGRIPPMIASLVTVTGLYSVSWTIIGRPTLFLQPEWILWSDGIGLLHIFLFAIAAAITIILLSRTLFGLRMRAVGENPLMGSALNIGIWRYTVLGLALSNALAALAGALFAQRIYIADINSGFGITLTALVPLLAAGAIVSSSRALATITALIAVFSVAYRMVFGVVLVLEVDPEMYRLVSAVGLALVFVLIRGRTPVIGAGIRWS